MQTMRVVRKALCTGLLTGRQAESRPFEPDDIKNGRQGLLLAAV